MIDGAGNEIRTRDPNLGKVVLYQLSYSRAGVVLYVWPSLCQARGFGLFSGISAAQGRPGGAQVAKHGHQGQDGGQIEKYLANGHDWD